MTWSFCHDVRRLVFSQSLISLDLIEDFLELSCRAKDEDKVSPYKGTFCVTISKSSRKNMKLSRHFVIIFTKNVKLNSACYENTSA